LILLVQFVYLSSIGTSAHAVSTTSHHHEIHRPPPNSTPKSPADLTQRITPKIGTEVWVQTNYGTVSASVFGKLSKGDPSKSCWDYRLDLEDRMSMVCFNITDVYSVLSNTIFLGKR
jgi:hypothetical protein